MKTETASTSNSLQSPVQVEKLDIAIFLRLNFLWYTTKINPASSSFQHQFNVLKTYLVLKRRNRTLFPIAKE